MDSDAFSSKAINLGPYFDHFISSSLETNIESYAAASAGATAPVADQAEHLHEDHSREENGDLQYSRAKAQSSEADLSSVRN
ncbi:hypothetical protein PoB_006065400 [Plakobranchus ocellatus]|uniref:Uncharacterized protein n=1 Tax=Plakobranchus ocellatus TaxID=259542 RepID=A0AAV4CQK8_9GAST|nr:hypothetical protein PoB_006065400 [Plakobranchus ocellatus]